MGKLLSVQFDTQHEGSGQRHNGSVRIVPHGPHTLTGAILARVDTIVSGWASCRLSRRSAYRHRRGRRLAVLLRVRSIAKCVRTIAIDAVARGAMALGLAGTVGVAVERTGTAKTSRRRRIRVLRTRCQCPGSATAKSRCTNLANAASQLVSGLLTPTRTARRVRLRRLSNWASCAQAAPACARF